MSALKPNTTAQKVMSVFFTWNYNDTMEATDGVSYSLGADTASDVIANPKAFVVGYLPSNAVVVGGAVQVLANFDTAGYDVLVGDLADADEYFVTADIKTAGAEVAIVPTGIAISTADEQAIVMTVASDDACTAGKAVLRVDYVIVGRSEEVTHPAV